MSASASPAPPSFSRRPLLFLLAVSWGIAALAVLPFQPGVRPKAHPYSFEFTAATTGRQVAQVFYHRGHGFNGNDSASTELQGGQPSRYQVQIPVGPLHGLRFDPMAGAGEMVLQDLVLRDARGRVILRFAPEHIVPSHQWEQVHLAEGRLHLRTIPDANDPQLLLPVPSDFDLPPVAIWRWSPYLLSVGIAGVVLSLLLFFLERRRAWRTSPVTLAIRRHWQLYPRASLLVLALLAVAASSYPVVFAGRSYVTPNYGTILLYEEWPTVPGSQDRRTAAVGRSDVGAIMWSHVPYSYLQHRALWEHGELPLWNRYNSAGVPLLGQGQSGFGDPLHFLVLLLRPSAGVWDLKFLLAKALFAFGLGLTAGGATQHRLAATVVTLAAPFIGFFLYRINHPAFFSLCYAPWILYGFWRLQTATTWRRALTSGLVLILANTAVLTSGTVKEAYMLLLGLNATGGLMLLCAAEPMPHRLRRLLIAAAAGLTFVALTAPVWLTFYDTLRHAYTSYDAPSAYQLPPGLALGIFDEVFLRRFQNDQRVYNGSLNVLFLLGLTWAVVRSRVLLQDRLFLALGLGFTGTTAFVFGVIPPAWILAVPFLRNVAHIDNSFLCVAFVQLPVLAAFGFREAWQRLGQPEKRADLFKVALALTALVALYLGTSQAVQRSDRAFLRAVDALPVASFVLPYALSLIAGTAVLLWAVRRWRTRGPSVALLACAVFGGVLLGWRFGWHVYAGWPDYVVSARARPDFAKLSPAIAAVHADQPSPARAVGFRGNLFPGWHSVYAIESINGPDALMSPYYRELMDAAGVDRLWDWRLMVTHESFEQLRPLYDLLGIRHYVDLRGDLGRLSQWFTLVQQGDLDVYRSNTAWPRAFFTDRIVTYESVEELVHLLQRGDGQPFAALPTAARPRHTTVDTPSAGTVIAADTYQLTTNRTAFRVTAPKAGLIVLQEAYWPEDFHVTLNGRPAELLRVNHAFKGVSVSTTGTHVIEFTYRPRRWRLSIILFWLGVGALAMMAVTAAAANEQGAKAVS